MLVSLLYEKHSSSSSSALLLEYLTCRQEGWVEGVINGETETYLEYAGRRESLMVSVCDSRASGPGVSPGWVVVFLGKTLTQCLSLPKPKRINGCHVSELLGKPKKLQGSDLPSSIPSRGK